MCNELMLVWFVIGLIHVVTFEYVKMDEALHLLIFILSCLWYVTHEVNSFLDLAIVWDSKNNILFQKLTFLHPV